MIKFLANENVPLATVEKLREEGFDIVSVSSEFPSIKDEAVILFASMENRVVINFDRDYGELIFKRGLQPPLGVIYSESANFNLKSQPRFYLIVYPQTFSLKDCLLSLAKKIFVKEKYDR
jgi:predicted nuclease of predicted toxin-antitoxin system